MSEQTQLTIVERRKSMALQADKIDQIAEGAVSVYGKSGKLSDALHVAQSIVDIRAAITSDMMRPIMALMNTPLGFMTDKDPKRAGKNGPPIPYNEETVKECFIESKLRGFYPVGNEWGIISGRFYAQKAGLQRKVEQFPGITDFKKKIGVPTPRGPGEVLVEASATWKLNGKPDEFSSVFAVKKDDYSSSEQSQGKAERKLYKAIHDRLHNCITPDGDASEGAINVESTVTNEAPSKESFSGSQPVAADPVGAGS